MHKYLQSVVFIDCFFLEGFDITLIRGEENIPISRLEP